MSEYIKKEDVLKEIASINIETDYEYVDGFKTIPFSTCDYDEVVRTIDNLPTYSFPDREKHYCKNCMFFNTVDIRNGVYVCGLKGGTVYGCDCCEEWKGSAVPKREKGTDLISRTEVLKRIEEMAKEPSVQKNADTVNGLIAAHKIVWEIDNDSV